MTYGAERAGGSDERRGAGDGGACKTGRRQDPRRRGRRDDGVRLEEHRRLGGKPGRPVPDECEDFVGIAAVVHAGDPRGVRHVAGGQRRRKQRDEDQDGCGEARHDLMLRSRQGRVNDATHGRGIDEAPRRAVTCDSFVR